MELSKKEIQVIEAMRKAEGLAGDCYISFRLHQTNLQDALNICTIESEYGTVEKKISNNGDTTWVTSEYENFEITAFIKGEDEI